MKSSKNSQKTKDSQVTLDKKNPTESITKPGFNLYLRATVTKHRSTE